jgi:hypothetical protein
MTRRTSLAILTLILLLAYAGRLIHIDAESLWVDEGFSYWAIRHDDMLGLILDDVHPPLYFIMLRGWAEVAGISELALRYLSLLAGMLSVAMMVPLAREVERLHDGRASWSVPVIAALLLALADMEIYIAQQVRMYTWHVLWVIVSMWAFVRWRRLFAAAVARVRAGERTPATGHIPMLIVWIAATITLLYTHYIGAAAVAVQAAYALIFMRGGARKVALGVLGIIGVVFVPWLLVIASGQTENVGTGFNVPSTLESLWNWRVEWFTQQWALMIGLLLLGVVALISRRGLVFLLLGWIIVPVAGAYVLNEVTPILMDYRLTQITPAIALLTAFGLGYLRQPSRMFLLLVIVAYAVTIYDTPRPRPPWREVGMNAARYAEPGDLALAHVEPSGDWQVMYYYERFMPEVERRSIRQWKREQPETYAAGLPALLAAHDSVWYMHWSSDRGVFDVLRQTGHVQTAVLTEDWLGNDLNVYRFDVPPDEPVAAFESGLVLRDAAIIADELRLDLWWSTPGPLDRNYTISAILLDEDGGLVAQDDAAPFMNQRPTTSFAPGELVYDPHVLRPVDGVEAIPPGTYTVGVKTYYFEGGGIVDVPATTNEEVVVIGTVTWVDPNGD